METRRLRALVQLLSENTTCPPPKPSSHNDVLRCDLHEALCYTCFHSDELVRTDEPDFICDFCHKQYYECDECAEDRNMHPDRNSSEFDADFEEQCVECDTIISVCSFCIHSNPRFEDFREANPLKCDICTDVVCDTCAIAKTCKMCASSVRSHGHHESEVLSCYTCWINDE